ncbi:DNA methylase, partial [Bacillus altitudinis]
DKYTNKTETIISTQSTSSLNQIEENSVDYIFTDPPFGKNLMYSELNFLWEAWLKVVTDNNDEAIMNNTQGKGVLEYQKIMVDSFRNYFKLLKPGRWMTVEFSNSQASVWNAIQESIQRAGFVIANVSALDKKQGSFKAVTTTTAVKQDLVISAYKPSNEIRDALRSIDNLEQSIWLFINQHLKQLPVFLGQKGEGQLIVERTPRILFDRLVSYYVQNGLNVPISSPEFQKELSSRFPQRDGMIFLEDQVAEYDKKRAMNNIVQMSWLVTDENSAIEWLRQQLLTKPQSRQDLHPNFMKEIQHIAKHELLPELDSLLEQNFLIYQSTEEVPSQIHSYLSSNYKDLRGLQKTDIRLIEKAKNRWYVPDPNKQADLEKLREKSLLREFEGYKSQIESNKKKLKQFRTESVRTGFKKAWSEKDYQTIVKIGERLPEKVLQEDDKLLMYFDNAQIRLGV